MRSSVQISYNTQRFDNWFKRHTQHTTRILAHEPTGYLREGDVVEFARFSPATMAERYESGKLNRRGGGVRYEVHRVVTPFGEPVAERKELPKEGELADRFGDVEFQRRSVELTKPWNKKDKKRRVGILEAMWEAIQMEVERVREQSSSKVKQVKVVEQAFAGSGETLSTDTLTEALSDAQKDIEIQLQKLRGESPSAAA